jgi:type I restriction enzyme S subunit
MSFEWVETTLGEVLTLQRGMDLPHQDRRAGIHPIVASTGIVGYHDTAPVKGAGVVIGRSGSIGGGQYIVQDFWPLNTTLWVKDFKGNDPRYCYYLLKSIDFSSMNAGSGVPTLNRNHLHPLKVVKPSLSLQKNIASILGNLDDRINLLRETNTTLETIAQALFKSWFIDFDPVRTKSEGNLPEGIDETTAALFTDTFEDTELGMVPKGWQVGVVDNLCITITNGSTPSRSKQEFWTDGAIPWFKTGELSDGFLLQPSERITEQAVQSSSVKVLPENSVLMAIYAAPTVGRLGVLTEAATFNQACTGMVAKPEVGTWFLYWTLYFGRDWFNSRANGAAQQNISKAIVSGYKVVIPDAEVLKEFNKLCESIHDAIRRNSLQAETLANIRNTLLPRLISGQLRIADAEAELEKVTA